MSLTNTESQFFPVNINIASDIGLNHDEEVGGEGQLAVDVVETETDLIVLATMAGALPSDVELSLHEDLLTIKGERHAPAGPNAHYHYRECYWGKFSRTIVLPVDIRIDSARAEYKHGLLTVVLPKARGNTNIPIFVVEE